MSGIVPAQVAEIIVALDGKQRRRGSGYRAAPGAVLTAAHVIDGAVSVRARFDADQPSEWSTEAISWWVDRRSDLAVLSIAPREGEPPVVVARFGWITNRPAVLAIRAVGFPRFKLRNDNGAPSVEDDRSWYRDSHQADGSIAVLSNRREGCTDPKPRCRSVTCGFVIRSGRSVVFVDHTAKYPVASDQAVEGQGGWPVLLAGGALAESLMRPVRIIVPGVLGQNPDGVAFVVDQDTVGALAATVRTNRSA